MSRSLFYLLLTPLLALAAPVPKDEVKAKIEKKYGTVTDPKADSKFDLDGDSLKITLPAGEERRFGYVKDESEKSGLKRFDHTPRVVEETDGGFSVDWESSVQYCEMEWVDFLAAGPGDPKTFRVLASRSDEVPPVRTVTRMGAVTGCR